MRTEAVRRALLVGINQYQDPRNNLKGCVNDVLAMGKLITENFGFNNEHIRLLIDQRATTANIRERLRWLVDDAGPGSVLLFHYSGHGSQVRDRNGDEMDDQLDEIICPYDLDWDDPFTDDEFAEVIEGVPEGVNLTLILDCCNSGTGTRQFFKEPGSRGRAQTRFLVPPPDVAFRMAAGVEIDLGTPERTVNMVGKRALSTRRFGSSLAEQNAILLSASRSDQTSADDWIGSDYRGAFTYSLVQAITSKRFSLSYSDLIEAAGSWLEANSYDQIPQLETRQLLQGWGFLGTEAQVGGVPVSYTPARETLAPPPDTRVVFVHGIGNQVAGYSERWRAAFNRHLGLDLDNYVEVLWDEVFSSRATSERNLSPVPQLTPEEQQRADELAEELRELIESRHELMMDLAEAEAGSALAPDARDRAAERGLITWLMNFDEYIGDFAKYLASEGVRAAVDGRLEGKLKPLLQSGVPTVLITHSWGTVVTHHTLRAIDSMKLPSLHCTLGSPLWMLPVRKMLGFDNRTRGCDYWINIDARGDLIGGPLAGKFAVNEDHSVASVGNLNAHASYFHPDNSAVQRDIIASAISKISGTH